MWTRTKPTKLGQVSSMLSQASDSKSSEAQISIFRGCGLSLEPHGWAKVRCGKRPGGQGGSHGEARAQERVKGESKWVD